MAWVRLDDRLPEHPKILEAGPAAAWLFVAGLCYCNRNDVGSGVIPASIVSRLCDVRAPKKLASCLVRVGLWVETCEGYQIHDYNDFQPSSEEIAQKRQNNKERQQRHRDRNKSRSRKDNAVTVPRVTGGRNAHPDPDPDPDPIDLDRPRSGSVSLPGLEPPPKKRAEAKGLHAEATRVWNELWDASKSAPGPYPWTFKGRDHDGSQVKQWLGVAGYEPGVLRLAIAAYFEAAWAGQAFPPGEPPTTRQFTRQIARWWQVGQTNGNARRKARTEADKAREAEEAWESIPDAEKAAHYEQAERLATEVLGEKARGSVAWKGYRESFARKISRGEDPTFKRQKARA